jgi:ABC-2 type transport system ATP-binding protein
MSEIILNISQMSKKYGSIEAVNKLDLTVSRGSVFGLLGPNGSGKSTTLGILLGVTKNDSGSFTWFGEAPSSGIRKRIGAILESPTFYPYLSARQNLKIVAEIKQVADYRIDEVITQVGLIDRADSPFKTFSLGMKQRLAIASALLADPELLILDEPTNGLDPQGIAEIRELIVAIAATGKTIILASHLLDEVQKVCTEFAVLKNGNKIFQGSVAETLLGNDGMELAAKDMGKLRLACEAYDGISSITLNNVGQLIIGFKAEVDIEKFHQYLINEGIVLCHLSFISKSLEKQFLALLSA